MSVEDAIFEIVRNLPVEKQQELLKHATSLRQELSRATARKNIRALWADLGISLSSEEIQGNQREMWHAFR